MSSYIRVPARKGDIKGARNVKPVSEMLKEQLTSIKPKENSNFAGWKELSS
jgi:hypothetical protein